MSKMFTFISLSRTWTLEGEKAKKKKKKKREALSVISWLFLLENVYCLFLQYSGGLAGW